MVLPSLSFLFLLSSYPPPFSLLSFSFFPPYPNSIISFWHPFACSEVHLLRTGDSWLVTGRKDLVTYNFFTLLRFVVGRGACVRTG